MGAGHYAGFGVSLLALLPGTTIGEKILVDCPVRIRLVFIRNLDGMYDLDPQPGHVFEYLIDRQRSTIVIGRSREVDMHLEHPTVGRRVARIYWTGEDAHVEDLGSGGGCYLNESRMRTGQTSQLHHGDELGIGCLRFRTEITKSAIT